MISLLALALIVVGMVTAIMGARASRSKSGRAAEIEKAASENEMLRKVIDSLQKERAYGSSIEHGRKAQHSPFVERVDPEPETPADPVDPPGVLWRPVPAPWEREQQQR